jgi:hypothetical protein
MNFMNLLQKIRYQNVQGLKIWKYCKKLKIKNFFYAVFGQFWSLDTSGCKKFPVIYVEEIIWSRSMCSIPGFRSILICCMCTQLLCWYVSLKFFAIFLIFCKNFMANLAFMVFCHAKQGSGSLFRIITIHISIDVTLVHDNTHLKSSMARRLQWNFLIGAKILRFGSCLFTSIGFRGWRIRIWGYFWHRVTAEPCKPTI